MALDQFSPQEQLELIYATLLIGYLESKDWIEGPFTVNLDECYAALNIVQLEPNIELPTREHVEDVAMQIMEEAGIEEDSANDLRKLLQLAEPDLEFAEEE